ncbi:DUF6207 family protein [Streptomyces sp. NPDC058657]|uniref:DUF6207 family protein n=1 Tax=unclassified Streptomyces TaxID=2593676 RepID=UPI003650E4B0
MNDIVEKHLVGPRTLVIDLIGCDEPTVEEAVARLEVLGAVAGHRVRRDAGMPGVRTRVYAQLDPDNDDCDTQHI